MPEERLFDKDELGFQEWSVTPKPEHLVPDQITRERERADFRAALRDDPDTVVITHTDADGLSSAALICAHEAGSSVIQPIDYHGAYRFEHVLEDLLDVDAFDLESTALYVCDFNLDDADIYGLQTVGKTAEQATWYDHHQWDDMVAEGVVRSGFDLIVDTDECTASLLLRELDTDFGAQLVDLAECTKDIDLWIREDPRSERLNTFATIAEDGEYVGTVLNHGADLPDDVQERIDERQATDETLEDLAVHRAEHEHINGNDVALTYSRGGRSSVIGNRLVEEHTADYDIAVVAKTHGGIGIYSHSDGETFARCHEVADQLGGGGHPTAAGCSVPADTFRDLAKYWYRAGEPAFRAVSKAIAMVTREQQLEDVPEGEEVTPDAE